MGKFATAITCVDGRVQLPVMTYIKNALEDNAKVVIPTGTELVNVIGELAGIVPLKGNQKEQKETA